MRLWTIVAIFFVNSFALSYAVPQLAPPADLQRFYGQVKAVDRSARTITIEMPMRFVFHIRDTTKIIESGGAAATFDRIKAGEGVDVVARHKGNTWTALTIKLKPGAHFPDVVSARTVRGQTVSGAAIGEFIIFEPPMEVVNRGINFGQNSGLFLISVKPDGTVGNVRVLKSLGLQELNERATRWLMKWRFRPNSITEARIPVTSNSFRQH